MSGIISLECHFCKFNIFSLDRLLVYPRQTGIVRRPAELQLEFQASTDLRWCVACMLTDRCVYRWWPGGSDLMQHGVLYSHVLSDIGMMRSCPKTSLEMTGLDLTLFMGSQLESDV
jgi:hypothetical protein